MSKKAKTVDPNRIGPVKFLSWSLTGASPAVQAVLLGFL